MGTYKELYQVCQNNKNIHCRQVYYASIAQVILVSNQYSLIACINHIPKPEDMYYAIPRRQIPTDTSDKVPVPVL